MSVLVISFAIFGLSEAPVFLGFSDMSTIFMHTLVCRKCAQVLMKLTESQGLA